MKEICPAKCPHCPFYKCMCRLEKIQVVEKEKA